jgi:hypothetical protein
MTNHSLQRAHVVPQFICFAALSLLAGCIDSAQPILTDGQPLLGERLRFEFYTLRDGAAREPSSETFHWRNARYVPTGGGAREIGAFTLHPFTGDDLIVQSLKPAEPAEYGIARKLADGVYLVIAVDEDDADQPTREQFCAKDAGSACRVTSRDAVLAFARATAAKPHAAGGLAVLLAD